MTTSSYLATTKLTRVDARSLADRVQEILRDAILLEGRFAPGERLSEEALAAELGVSKTPVHDALIRLSAEGLVRIVPYQGAFVIKHTPHDVDEIHQLRKSLELLAMDLAQPHLDDQVLSELLYEHEQIKRPLEGSQGFYDFEMVNRHFHDALAAMSQNQRLVDFLRILRARAVSRHYIAMRFPGRDDQALDEHVAILKALLARDHGRAKQLMAEHLDITHQNHRLIALELAQAESSSD